MEDKELLHEESVLRDMLFELNIRMQTDKVLERQLGSKYSKAYAHWVKLRELGMERKLYKFFTPTRRDAI